MIKLNKWMKLKHMEVVPNDVKEFIEDAKRAEQKINFPKHYISSKAHRRKIRNDLMMAKNDVSNLMKKFHTFIQKGNKNNRKSQEYNSVIRIIKKIRQAQIELEKGKKAGDNKITSNTPETPTILSYENLLRKVMDEMFYQNIKETLEEIEIEEEFYKILLDKVNSWAMIQTFENRKVVEDEEEETITFDDSNKQINKSSAKDLYEELKG